MSKDNFALSTGYLKKVVPLLMKHQVPATPTNYALWYTYVADSDTDLSWHINESIQATGTLSETQCEQLYQSHFADKKVKEADDFQQSLQALALEMGNTMEDTLKDTDTFQNTLDKTFSQLSRVGEETLSMDETIAVVRSAVKGSNQIRQSTSFFKNQLADAQREIARLKETLAQANEEALHDALTGIFNRRAFDSELGALANSPPPKGFSLLLCDLDHFKNFNDTYGHLMGDQVLKLTAKRLSDYCREGIQAFRYGGEEFALLVPNRQLKGACRVAETIRASIDKLVIKDKKTSKKLDNITVSIGVAQFDKGDSIRSMIARADAQLYEAKNLGRNRVMPIP
ncbi:GGDEF domain-containing protein [Enterovibrio sp. ZSDZ42]|uniref:diguanylate cyclase n=1 Tax=Enterovibrio gelatinilyticus TaxID=2899819 RepID=A0ABT5R5K3_9GAMM|nr:GGDEF domain-containing protein [Enterovibrio sp. ZSDZ42]MDD1795563.1 GGDEF domain-containing protein [Enterovibrio sp. ZSDZ42]